MFMISSSASKRRIGGPGGLKKVGAMPPINQLYAVVSGAVAKFLCAVPHDDVLKYLWDYIIANQLEV